MLLNEVPISLRIHENYITILIGCGGSLRAVSPRSLIFIVRTDQMLTRRDIKMEHVRSTFINVIAWFHLWLCVRVFLYDHVCSSDQDE